jgi:flagellar motor switch protein FliN/FliY
MDGMLSQDEINALLQGMDLSDTADSGASPETPQDSSSAENTDNAYVKDVAPTVGDEEELTDVEKDAIGEVANISMGSSATTLYSLVNRKVNITTPVVTLATWKTLLDSYEKPCVFIQIKYTQGLDGTNILVLKEHDVKVITDLMMGGDGTNTEGELGELHLSAISEAMNQMMGAAATSLSTLLQTVIDISPPESSLFDLTEVKDGKEISPFLGGTFVKISFRMQIDDLVDSTIMQLYPIDFARKLVETFINTQMANIDEVTEKKPEQPEYVPLELTESAFLEDEAGMYRRMESLRERGFLVSMDDFGTGYSTMNMLKNQTLDEIKIDREFIRDLEKDKSLIIIRNTIAMLQQLGVHIVIEGVETEEQKVLLSLYVPVLNRISRLLLLSWKQPSLRTLVP